MLLNEIHILGVDRKPEYVRLNGNTISFEYIEIIKKLSLINTAIDLSSKMEVIWN